MFFSANNLNGSSSDISLAGLMTMNMVNAQAENSTGSYTQLFPDCVATLNGEQVPGTVAYCSGGDEPTCHNAECVPNAPVTGS